MAKSFPITAYAINSALGATAEEVCRNLRGGRSGLAPCRLPAPFETTVGALIEAPPPLPDGLATYDGRPARLLWRLLGALQGPLRSAMKRWGAGRVGVILGTSAAGDEATEDAYRDYVLSAIPPAKFVYEHHLPHALLDLVRIRCGLTGPGYVVSTACSSSAKVFGAAQRLLASGLCDAVLVGGIDTLSQLTLRGFKSLSLLSEGGCKPFAADRAGTSLGEGGALLLLEREGDGPGWLLGVGETSDAFHMTAPHPEGLGAAGAMSQALGRAGLDPGQIDCVNAHGTGTLQNDSAEARAIESVLGTTVPVVSTKGYTGHALGAAGALEAVLSIMAIEHGHIPASLGAEPVDPLIRVNVATRSLERRCRRVLSNSFAFGGNNASVVFGAAAS